MGTPAPGLLAALDRPRTMTELATATGAFTDDVAAVCGFLVQMDVLEYVPSDPWSVRLWLGWVRA